MKKNIFNVESIALTRLNILEFTNFHTRFLGLVKTATPEKLGVEDYMEEYESKLLIVQDLAKRSLSMPTTALLLQLDNNRDCTGSYLMTNGQSAKNSPIAEQRDAYEVLKGIFELYKGFQRYPNREETAAIDGLILDLRKPEMAKAIATLNLTGTVDQLEKDNNAYAVATETRRQEHDEIVQSKGIRNELNDLYKEMVAVIVAKNIMTPDEAIKTFITALNGVIYETKTTYDERIKRAENKKEDPKK